MTESRKSLGVMQISPSTSMLANDKNLDISKLFFDVSELFFDVFSRSSSLIRVANNPKERRKHEAKFGFLEFRSFFCSSSFSFCANANRLKAEIKFNLQ